MPAHCLRQEISGDGLASGGPAAMAILSAAMQAQAVDPVKAGLRV
jgi:hypothetical protein